MIILIQSGLCMSSLLLVRHFKYVPFSSMLQFNLSISVLQKGMRVSFTLSLLIKSLVWFQIVFKHNSFKIDNLPGSTDNKHSKMGKSSFSAKLLQNVLTSPRNSVLLEWFSCIVHRLLDDEPLKYKQQLLKIYACSVKLEFPWVRTKRKMMKIKKTNRTGDNTHLLSFVTFIAWNVNFMPTH